MGRLGVPWACLIISGLLVAMTLPAVAQSAKERRAKADYETGLRLYLDQDWSGSAYYFERALDNSDRASVRVMLASSLAHKGTCDRVKALLDGIVWTQIPKGAARDEARRLAGEARDLCGGRKKPSR
ncbi:MAG TPA: hypothetical protein PLQ97_13740 [Myxococcota bacterium]|nr:hypothetical protein [Myxococcota bacterium]HQK52332.1 hypothetical protein [Myxococcota bacterium]